jgi:hypothetical protein
MKCDIGRRNRCQQLRHHLELNTGVREPVDVPDANMLDRKLASMGIAASTVIHYPTDVLGMKYCHL